MNERLATPFSRAMAELPDNRKATVARFIGNIIAHNRRVSEEDIVDKVKIFGDSSTVVVVPYIKGKSISRNNGLRNETRDVIERMSRASYFDSVGTRLAPKKCEGLKDGEEPDFMKRSEMIVINTGSIAKKQREKLGLK